MGKNSSKFENQNNENINQSGGDHHLNPLIRPKAFFKKGVLTNDGIIENLIREQLGFRTQTWAPENRILLIRRELPRHYTRLVSEGIIPRSQPRLAVSPQPRAVVLSSPQPRALSPRRILSRQPPAVDLSSPQPRAVVLSSPQPSPLSPRRILSRERVLPPRRILSRQPPAVVLSSQPLPQPRHIQQRVVSSVTQYKKCNRCGQIVDANRRSCTNQSCRAVFIN